MGYLRERVYPWAPYVHAHSAVYAMFFGAGVLVGRALVRRPR